MRFPRAIPVLVLALASGCGSPNPVNNKLRAENQKLQEEIDGLKRERASDRAAVESLQAKVGTVPTLPRDRLDKLFTVAGLKLGRLTGGDNWDASKTGDSGIKVEAVPLDQDGQPLKVAGGFTVDAFDLAQSGEQQVGHWAFPVDQARANWYGGMLNGYVMKCPWQKTPGHAELTVKVVFRDELTGREFAEQKVVKVKLPAVR